MLRIAATIYPCFVLRGTAALGCWDLSIRENSKIMAVVSCPAGYVLHEKERSYYGSGTGWLSIKSFAGGRAFYEVGRNRYAVDDGSYLLLNHGQEYSVHIQADTPIESLCVFFAPNLAESIRQRLTLSDDQLLDAPGLNSPLLFFEKTYLHDDSLTPRLRQMLRGYKADSAALEEQFHGLMEQLLRIHCNVYKEVESLPAARPATREELYRRIHYARDYAAALFDTTVTLDQLAEVACLSPNHLLRTFRQVFQQTPHQFITDRRLAEAKRLLRDTDDPVTQICCAVGFASPGSFGWMFRRRFGVSPGEYRRLNR